MRILVLTYETPGYPGGGGASRQHSLLEPLAGRHEVRVLTTGGEPKVGHLPAGVKVEMVEPGPEVGDPPGPWLGKNLRHYASGPPWRFRTAMHHQLALANRLPEALRTFAPDVVHVEHAEIEMLLDRLPRAQASVLMLQNILFTLQYQDVFRGSPWNRLKTALELPVLARQSRRDLELADVTITTTERDRRQALRLSPRARVRVVPNCVNSEYFRRAGARHPEPTVVFVGSFYYQPNLDAASELVNEVWPSVRAAMPAARLRLVGQQVPEVLHRLAGAAPGVGVVDTPADVREEMWQAWLLAAPLRSGSGSQLKVMEAQSASLPVVTTPRVASALGLGTTDGVEVAEAPTKVAQAIIDLLRDDARRERMSAAAEASSARFDRRRAAPLLEDAWREATEVARARNRGGR